MYAYLPSSRLLALELVAILIATLGLGLANTLLARGAVGRALAWSLVVLAAIGTERLTATEPGGLRMLAICAVVLLAMKAVVSVGTGAPRLGAARWLWFAAGWPGMRPDAFAPASARASRPATPMSSAQLVRLGLSRIALGAALLAIARAVWQLTDWTILATALALPALSLIGHFGVFNVVAGVWRSRGADTGRLFVAPLLARDLGEFWGRRWNLAFSEMTRLAVYRPLLPRVGKRVATAAAFVFSGLLHELAISVPVRAGFGLPLLYFALHAAAMLAEDALARRGTPIAGMGWIGRAWTLGWLALPMPILFHPAFLRGVIWPLLGAHG